LPQEGALQHYDLIATEDYAGLPDDPEQCFVEIEAICRRNLTRILDSPDSSADVAKAVMATYMSIIAATGTECGVANLDFNPAGDLWDEYATFSITVQGIVARIQIRHRGARNPYSVQLTARAKGRVEIEIAKLRQTISAESALDDGIKSALNRKLDELVAEMNSGTRLNFGKVFATLAFTAATLAAVTTISADGPQAIANIMKLIGAEKLTEEDAVKRLTPPPKLLEGPKKQTKPSPPTVFTRRDFASDLDDDIPF
jgi:hypothetical protein